MAVAPMVLVVPADEPKEMCREEAIGLTSGNIENGKLGEVVAIPPIQKSKVCCWDSVFLGGIKAPVGTDIGWLLAIEFPPEEGIPINVLGGKCRQCLRHYR